MRYPRLSIVVLVIIAVGIPFWIFSPRPESPIERRHATFDDREVDFLIAELSHEWRWELVNDATHPKTTEAWKEERHADMVLNAAYFNEDFTPSGFLKTGSDVSETPWPDEEQQRDEYGYTFLLQVEPHDFHLSYLPNDPQAEPTGASLLSFPSLLVDAQPLIREDSKKYAQRTIIAEDAHGKDFLIQTEKGVISLYEATQWLAQQPEHFTIAGNLDGGPSTGLWLENGDDDINLPSAAVPSVILGYQD